MKHKLAKKQDSLSKRRVRDLDDEVSDDESSDEDADSSRDKVSEDDESGSSEESSDNDEIEESSDDDDSGSSDEPSDEKLQSEKSEVEGSVEEMVVGEPSVEIFKPCGPNNAFRVSNHGSVIDANGKAVRRNMSDGKLYAYFPHDNHIKRMQVAVLVMVTFGLVRKGHVVKHINGNLRDCRFENLTWVPRKNNLSVAYKLIANPEFESFKPTVVSNDDSSVPMYLPPPKYLGKFPDSDDEFAPFGKGDFYWVSRNNEVRNQYGKVLAVTCTKRGTCLINLDRERNCSIHRLRMLVWHPITKPELFQVDHIDNDCTNHNLSNLQWLSGLDNNKKAAEVKLLKSPISATFPDGKITFHHSKDAAAFFGVSVKFLYYKIKAGTTFLKDGMSYTLACTSTRRKFVRDHREGFAVIPNWPKYEIHPDSTVRNVKTKIVSNPYVNEHGYCYVILAIYHKDISVHHLVMLTFGPVNTDPEKTQINHKNGKRDDNDLRNLEWVTPSENQIHRHYILTNKLRPVQMDRNGNVLKVWKSIATAGRSLGINTKNIGETMRQKAKKSAGGFLWRYQLPHEVYEEE